MRMPLSAARRAGPLLLAAALAGCGTHEPAQPPPTAAIDGLRTVTVAAGAPADGRAWDGVVEAVRQATLTAQTSGRVTDVLRDVNDRVAAGEVLVRLSAVEQQSGVDAARAQLRASEAAAAEAEGNYRRYLELSQARYVSASQLDQTRAMRDSAVAARDAARARVADAGQQAAYTTVRAPYAGIVGARAVEPGESVGLGQPLVSVFAPGDLRIDVRVPQSEAEALRADPRAVVTFDDGRRIEIGALTVFPAADAATHAVRVRVVLPPLEAPPQPGTTARVAFPAVRGAALPRVPATALVQRGEVSAVYVLAEGRLSLRQVRPGAREADTVEVIAGLRAGETVAIDPVAALQALVAARGTD
jgi:RND family efflux transporter MFP subunit